MDKQASGRVRRLLPWAMLGLCLAASLLLYARLGRHNMDADRASEFVLAAHLNETGSLVSPEWFYSTELRVVSPVPVYQLALALFPSWHAARLFSIAVLMGLCTLSFLVLARRAGFGEEAVYAAAAMVLPLGWTYSFLYSWGGFYTVYFSACCWALTLVLSWRPGRWWVPVLLAVLGVWCGLSGVRMLMMCALPVGTAFSLRALGADADRQRREQALMALVLCAGMAAGYVINARVLSGSFSFRSYGQVRCAAPSCVRVLQELDALCDFFGYRPGVALASGSGAVNLLVLVLVPALPVLTGMAAVRFRGSPRGTLAQVALCAVGGGMVINSAAEGFPAAGTSVAYYILGILLMLLMVFAWVSERTRGWVRSTALCALTLGFAANAFFYVREEQTSRETAREKAAAWLVEQGYVHGYSTFWNGNVLTELSDGKLRLTCFGNFASGAEPYEWLQTRESARGEFEGPLFVYTDDEEQRNDPTPLADPERLVYGENGVQIYRYDSWEEVLRIQREHVRGKGAGGPG